MHCTNFSQSLAFNSIGHTSVKKCINIIKVITNKLTRDSVGKPRADCRANAE